MPMACRSCSRCSRSRQDKPATDEPKDKFRLAGSKPVPPDQVTIGFDTRQDSGRPATAAYASYGPFNAAIDRIDATLKDIPEGK